MGFRNILPRVFLEAMSTLTPTEQAEEWRPPRAQKLRAPVGGWVRAEAIRAKLLSKDPPRSSHAKHAFLSNLPPFHVPAVTHLRYQILVKEKH